ncbi:MAG TPA: hypothetical protein VFG10_00860 [Saprospiraceae bacterium]|nr:hypothetical protein [Saprospiraceae bacterium]
MKLSILKYCILYLLFLSIMACGNDTSISYPVSYTFSHTEEGIEGLFLINNPTSGTPIAVNTGEWGEERSDIKAFTLEFMQEIFDIQEIILLNEDQVRLHIISDGEELDTTVNYTMEDEEIIIAALDSSNLISYNSDLDQFELCGFTYGGIPGPNTINPGQQYGIVHVQECIKNYDLQDYLNFLLNQHDFNTLDTIGMFEMKVVYK